MRNFGNIKYLYINHFILKFHIQLKHVLFYRPLLDSEKTKVLVDVMEK